VVAAFVALLLAPVSAAVDPERPVGPVAAVLEAQVTERRPLPAADPIQSRVATVPFGPGERMSYEVRLGPVPVGDGIMEILGVVPVRGVNSYHASLRIAGGIPLARVNDHYQTWFDVRTLASRRFIQDIHQVRHRNYRHFEIFPEEGRWERGDDSPDEGEITAEIPLDEIAFLYYVRTLPLEVGETYELHQYFREDRNPVILEVLRREEIEVPAGTFQTIVVRPIIKAGGLFGEGGEAQVYFTDDEDRRLVRLESRVPVVGSLSLHLREVMVGRPLRR
jgi:hypothetical protein